jgi:hypothetical protein
MTLLVTASGGILTVHPALANEKPAIRLGMDAKSHRLVTRPIEAALLKHRLLFQQPPEFSFRHINLHLPAALIGALFGQ